MRIFNDMNENKFSELMKKNPPAPTTKTKKNGSMQSVKKSLEKSKLHIFFKIEFEITLTYSNFQSTL